MAEVSSHRYGRFKLIDDFFNDKSLWITVQNTANFAIHNFFSKSKYLYNVIGVTNKTDILEMLL